MPLRGINAMTYIVLIREKVAPKSPLIKPRKPMTDMMVPVPAVVASPIYFASANAGSSSTGLKVTTF